LVIRLDVLLERLVELDLAGRDDGFPQLRTGRGELETLAVHVVAVRDCVGDDRRVRIDHARRKFECRVGRQEILVGARGARRQRDEEQEPGQRARQAKGTQEVGHGGTD
jgi:hypothetical protein